MVQETQSKRDSKQARFRGPVKRYLVLAALLLASPVAAQPVQPVPAASTPVSELLASAPQRDLSNGDVYDRFIKTGQLPSAR